MGDITNTCTPQVESTANEVPNDPSKITNIKEIATYDSKDMPSLELSLKQLRDVGENGTGVQERNILRHSDLSAFSRYNAASTANQAPTGNVGSCSPVNNSSEVAKAESIHNLQSKSSSTPNQRSNGSSNNNDMGSSTNNFFIKPDTLIDKPINKPAVNAHSCSAFQPVQHGHTSSLQAMVPGTQDTAKAAVGQARAMHQKFQVQHHHHHYHHHHHHVLSLQQRQQLLNADASSLRNAVETAPDCGTSDMVGTPVEGNAANYGSASGSNNGSNGQNGSSGQNFVRTNPRSDFFTVKRFHHIEFWCGDATNTARRFSWGLGLPIAAISDLSTGNSVHASYLLRSSSSSQLQFLFTAPYSSAISTSSSASIPTFSVSSHRSFTATHGLGVRAIALEVENSRLAFSTCVAHGAKPVSEPVILNDEVVIAEVHLYGDVVLRFVSFLKDSNCFVFLPGFESVEGAQLDYGIRRLDHAVGNVPELGPVVEYIKSFTGFHEFAEFTAEDVGTAESGLNSVVLANNDETVLFPLNEPVYGTKRKSQIQTYLEHNEGAGVQHLALVTEDIFRTLREMRKRSGIGGFEFMPSPPPTYYKNLKTRAGDILSDEQIQECEELGILVDRDDQGTLLQIFTKPVGDRPTIFLEIIQRIGCMLKNEEGELYQKGGCGGFGKGNFSELFKSIEEYEKTLEAKQNTQVAIA